MYAASGRKLQDGIMHGWQSEGKRAGQGRYGEPGGMYVARRPASPGRYRLTYRSRSRTRPNAERERRISKVTARLWELEREAMAAVGR